MIALFVIHITYLDPPPAQNFRVCAKKQKFPPLAGKNAFGRKKRVYRLMTIKDRRYQQSRTLEKRSEREKTPFGWERTPFGWVKTPLDTPFCNLFRFQCVQSLDHYQKRRLLKKRRSQKETPFVWKNNFPPKHKNFQALRGCRYTCVFLFT